MGMAVHAARTLILAFLAIGLPLRAQVDDSEGLTPAENGVDGSAIPASENAVKMEHPAGTEPQNSDPPVTAPAKVEKNGSKSDTANLAPIDIVDLNQIGIEEATDKAGTAPELPASIAKDITGTIRIEEILEPPSEYHYASFGKENPFQAPDLKQVSDMPAGTVSGAEIPIVSPLQEYALNDLMLKGIWQLESGEWRAIVMTPKKEGIIVKEGDPISVGKVLAIDRSKVMSRQYQIRADGTRHFKDQYLELLPEKRKEKIILAPGKEAEFPKNAAISDAATNEPAVPPPVSDAAKVSDPTKNAAVEKSAAESAQYLKEIKDGDFSTIKSELKKDGGSALLDRAIE